MRPPPPPGPSSQHHYQSPSQPQAPHYQSGPPPPHHHTQQTANANDWGQRRSVSHDPYAASDNNSYNQLQGPGYTSTRPPPAPPPSSLPSASPYNSYSQQASFNSDDGGSREPSFGPDRYHGGPNRRGIAEPYNRDGTVPLRPPPPPLSSSPDHDPRTADEKPCRTLFIRNLGNNTSSDSIRLHFLQFGEIKTFYDVITKKGMCFVTFYDLRGAEWAKNTSHQQEFNGRKMDVHYSLPKDTDTSKRCDRDQNQGTLFMLLKRITRAFQDEEFSTIFSSYGEVKSVRRYKDQKNARFLEFYDSRACVAAHDGMGGKQFTDPVSGLVGEWDVKFAWDAQQIGKGKGKGGLPHEQGAPPPSIAIPSSVGGGGWPPPPPSMYQQGGSPPRPSMGYEARPPPLAPSSYAPSGPPSASYGYNAGAGSTNRPPVGTPQGPAQWGSVARPPPPMPPTAPSGPASNGGPAPPGGGGEEKATSRLEQAQKVQQLLASLSSGGGNNAGATTTLSSTSGVPSSWQAGVDGGRDVSGGGGVGTTGQRLPPNLAQLLAGVGAGTAGQQGGQQQQHGTDPRRSAGGGGGGGSTSAADAQESIQRMLAMLGQGATK